MLHIQQMGIGLGRGDLKKFLPDIVVLPAKMRRRFCPVGIDEGDRVHFPQLNRTFKLDVKGEAEDGIFIKWEVAEDAVP